MEAIDLTKDNFEQEVLQANTPVIVDFWATWCGPCRAQSPILDQLVDKENGKIKICKVNVDEQPELAIEFNVMSIPTLLFYKNGEKIQTLVGLQEEEKIRSVLEL